MLRAIERYLDPPSRGLLVAAPNDDAAVWRGYPLVVATTDPAQAKQLYSQVQQSEAQSSHVIPLYFPDLVFLTSAKVTGFSSDPYGTYSYPTIAFK